MEPAGAVRGGIRLPSLDIFATYAPDSLSADIVVTPTGGTFIIGAHAIRFPANSICDPTSSYGESEWDRECSPASGDLNFHVEVRRDSTGRSWMDFTPSVRFVPTDSADQYVVIFMNTQESSEAIEQQRPPILWAQALGADGVDEAATDSTLRTQQIPGTGIVYRRIKHFSGYQVGLEVAGDPITSELIEDTGSTTEGDPSSNAP